MKRSELTEINELFDSMSVFYHNYQKQNINPAQSYLNFMKVIGEFVIRFEKFYSVAHVEENYDIPTDIVNELTHIWGAVGEIIMSVRGVDSVYLDWADFRDTCDSYRVPHRKTRPGLGMISAFVHHLSNLVYFPDEADIVELVTQVYMLTISLGLTINDVLDYRLKNYFELTYYGLKSG